MQKSMRLIDSRRKTKTENKPHFSRTTRSMSSSFRTEHDADKRTAEARRIRAKYPDRIPVM